MKRRLFALLLALVLLCALLPQGAIPASAATSGACGPNLRWSFDAATGTLTITGTGDMNDYDVGKAPWFGYASKIKTLRLPEGLKSVGNGAFYCCAITTAAIPDSVLSIGNDAFSNCSQLTSVKLSGSVAYIGSGSFTFTMLRSVAIPDSVVGIGEDAFSYTSLKTVILSEGVKYLGGRAFFYTPLTTLLLPAGLNHIGTGVTERCWSLKHVWFTGDEAAWKKLNDKNPIYVYDAQVHLNAVRIDPYADVEADAWYRDAANAAVTSGAMGSTDPETPTFEPYTKVSRAMVASILYRLAGSPGGVAYTGRFTDVPNGQWFTTAVEWCAQNGLASGKGDGRFDPNGQVTRQELAVFMYKLAALLGRDVSTRADLSGFPDAKTVPDWAKPYLQWAVAAGMITGKAQTSGKALLAPADTAMRCELASILQRFDRDPTLLGFDRQQRSELNSFLTLFSRDALRSFDRSEAPDQPHLVTWAYLYCEIFDDWKGLGYAFIDGENYDTLAASRVDELLNRFFGIKVTHAGFPINERFSVLFDGTTYYFPSAAGEAWNNFTLARAATDNGDGTYTVQFDVYSLDLDAYRNANDWIVPFYFALTPTAAAARSDLTLLRSGTAVIENWQADGQATYRLIRYHDS